MNLYWFGYEWKQKDETVALGSTVYGINSGKLTYNNYSEVAEKIKEEVYKENPMVTFLAEGPFITSVYRLDYNSKLFQSKETTFVISYVANTADEKTIKAQICTKVCLNFNNFINNDRNLIVAFSKFLDKMREEIEKISKEKFESFNIYYLLELD